jgi:hypothetical protein
MLAEMNLSRPRTRISPHRRTAALRSWTQGQRRGHEVDFSVLRDYRLPSGLSVAGIALILIGSAAWGADNGSVIIKPGVILAA